MVSNHFPSSHNLSNFLKLLLYLFVLCLSWYLMLIKDLIRLGLFWMEKYPMAEGIFSLIDWAFQDYELDVKFYVATFLSCLLSIPYFKRIVSKNSVFITVCFDQVCRSKALISLTEYECHLHYHFLTKRAVFRLLLRLIF